MVTGGTSPGTFVLLMNRPLRIGILGAGHLGRIHMRCLQAEDMTWDWVGFYDPNTDACHQVKTLAESESWAQQAHAFGSAQDLLDAVDAVAIVTPTASHAHLAEQALQSGVHCFIEKPVTTTLSEAHRIADLQADTGLVVQVGHVERFNPAFQATRDHLTRPRFIEAHRLAPFNPRGLDVSVVHDLMIHDIDLALHAFGSEVIRVAANGVTIAGDQVDLANARLEFASGAVANLTASRVSMSPMRKVRIFQPDAYLSVDLLNRSANMVKLEPVNEGEERDPYGMYLDVPGKPVRRLHVNAMDIDQSNAISEELKDFYAACTGGVPQVPLRDGLSALMVAQQVMDCIESNPQT